MVLAEVELIKRSQSGDAVAFSLLAERYERRIYSLALHYCRNAEDAEDLSQEAWLKAFQALSTFRGESNFYTWLRKITINCFLNHQRARFSRRRLESTNVEPIGADAKTIPETSLAGSNLEMTVQNRILVSQVLKALAEVTPNQRLIFLLKHHEGMTCEEIAQELNCSSGTVKKSLSRTLAKLRTSLNTDNQASDYVPCIAGQY